MSVPLELFQTFEIYIIYFYFLQNIEVNEK